MTEQKNAFHSINTSHDNIRKGVEALCHTIGLNAGSLSTPSNKLAEYDLFSLLYAYMNYPDTRVKIHDLIKKAED